MIHNKYYQLLDEQKQMIEKKNSIDKNFYNGVYNRYENPVITAEHIPLLWRYDLDKESNPNFIERLGVNAALNPGAIYYDDKYYLMVRVEGNDRKSFFALAASDNGIDNFEFIGYPIIWDDVDSTEVNCYDVRLVHHEDGYIYGIYCSEAKDSNAPLGDQSMAIAQAGVLRTKDLQNWERLPNIKTSSPQQRNVVLHPEFVNGKYALYTRPQDGFISTGSGGGIAIGYCESMEHPVIDKEYVIEGKEYHTIYEVKNGQGPAPIKTDKGWIHIAHGVRNTAAGLRYVLYTYATDLHDVTKVIAKPSGYFMAPEGQERVGDVSNVVFCNGVIVKDENVYIYYASSDTRCHVATTTVDLLVDYTFNSPEDPLRSLDCAKQRIDMIKRNEELLNK